jgi:hypothetical protein
MDVKMHGRPWLARKTCGNNAEGDWARTARDATNHLAVPSMSPISLQFYAEWVPPNTQHNLDILARLLPMINLFKNEHIKQE